ncbi:MAG: bifunctional phosphoribosyl-AMP cyclohydrolase/phosphoribosyl-ATP diphosphatase HisIE [Gemmatimonadaceae bacterium]
MLDLSALDFAKGGGFVSVVCQDAHSGAVLMVARANRAALERTLATGEMHYHSRTRGLWHKGAVSGNVQRVVSLSPDCDGDAVLARVKPAGPACHTGAVSCFAPSGSSTAIATTENTAAPANDVLDRLAATIAARAAARGGVSEGRPSYTQRLLEDRNLRLKKLGEEALELAVACADADAERAAQEGADLIFHTLVALSAVGVTLNDVRQVLAAREA